MHPFLRFLLLLFVALAGTGAFAQKQVFVPMPPPGPPLLRVQGAAQPIELRRVQVDAQLAGTAAQTRVELEFYNPNDRLLEGELQFPLQAGQSVTGFALDINGELRAAVPVEKAKGRQVFEDVTRRRIDPALLEATVGNNYKLRVYPLPAHGTRRVVLEIAESLEPAHGAVRWLLPLEFRMPAARLDVTVSAPHEGLRAQFGAQRLQPRTGPGDELQLAFSRSDYRGREQLQVDLPLSVSAPQVLAQTFQDASYFYAEVPVTLAAQPRRAPRNIALVWDASGSGANRDIPRELALLEQLFRTLRNVSVQLLVVRDVEEPVQAFDVRDADWSALRAQLQSLPYDGATRLERMAVLAGAELALLFSDGLGSYGEGGLPQSSVPLYAISSAAAADAARLRQVAESSGGQWLDLARSTPADAAREVLLARTRLVALSADGATELVADSRAPRQGRIAVAGRLTQPQAELTLQFQRPDGGTFTRRVAIAPTQLPAERGASIAAQRWATLTLATLEAERERNAGAIRRIGTRFGLATSGTSLIVLDAVADYVRYGIEPPPALRGAYEQMVAQQRSRLAIARESHLDAIARRFADKQAWWDRDFPRDTPPAPLPVEKKAAAAALAERARVQPGRPAPIAPAPLPAPAMQAPGMAARIAPAPAPFATQDAARAAPARAAGDSTIALQKWTPDAPYIRRLRNAAPQALYATYLDERPAYTASTAFFLDVADLFLERGQRALALRILSNLAEMELENRQVLRILAYRLLQAREVKTALPLLRKVVALAPDEPQSFRDLGLALAADKQPQEAVDQLWEVVARPWNDRFPDIELVALAELNAIAARAAAAGQGLDLAAIDRRLLRNLPLDLRVVLAWDADNTDIDLWVIDPNGERAYYGHMLTYQGGRMSRDVTGGYGPEEFSLKHAKPGTYTIKARFFGHRQQVVAPATTLMLRLSTGFGTAAQQDVETVLRLGGAGEEVTVGTFEVGAH